MVALALEPRPEIRPWENDILDRMCKGKLNLRPLIGSPKLGLNDADTDDLTQAPAEVDVGGEMATKSNRTDFGGIGDGD